MVIAFSSTNLTTVSSMSIMFASEAMYISSADKFRRSNGTHPSGVPLISSDDCTQRGSALMMFRVAVAVVVVMGSAPLHPRCLCVYTINIRPINAHGKGSCDTYFSVTRANKNPTEGWGMAVTVASCRY